ncbi:MAG: N-6 DNA methylase [Verrucomicrobiaceae bacterium]|nr:N-6 DNA methylase [Verrucomicrobiaceae bacterium]
MSSPQTLQELVTRFAEHIDAYKSGSYNETQLRRDFLDPFFKLLGWDIDNAAGYSEAYRDVIHEDQVKVGGAVKAPDYGFRIGGTRKFFLEAKKPSVRIKDDISPAYQLRRYAWSAKLPLSILSDFEEFAIYDTRIKPKPNDPASKARIFYCRFDEYVEKWDFIASIFSREAILKGSFDKFAAANKGKRGTAEVDADFLATIEGWRADLARNLALRNPALTQRELNFAVQRILDRIIFLRICEDRGIEDYERLKRATEAKAIYPELVKLFQQADDRYNSGLFHFRAEKGRHEEIDTLTPHLVIDDKLLKGIITSLYYPASPYEFSVLSADILGQVYEQFLGKVITLTAGHRAQVEDKPEVKKAGGVFYTPTYIVDYIVRQTVGPLIESKTPKQIEKLTVLDPACGSGSFLIGAYQFLLDWYHRYYTTHDPETHAKGKMPKLVAAAAGGWALTTTERKRILLTHIYGVDIDSQAVEVTKLSLLLKVLEGETAQTVQRELIHERVLPDLGDNIKCGNSLIASDFYAQPGLPEMDTEAHLRLNVFDWDGKDGFPEIMKRGGFDAVIGNPPYVRMELFKELKSYLASAYASHDERTDLYVYFIEKSLLLLRTEGRYGVIVSNKWLRSKYGSNLRAVVRAGSRIEAIVDFGELPVFRGAATFPVIVEMVRTESPKPHVFRVLDGMSKDDFIAIQGNADELIARVKSTGCCIQSSQLDGAEWRLVDSSRDLLLKKLQSRGMPLESYVGGAIRYGIKTGLVAAFVIDRSTRDRLIDQSPCVARLIKPYLVGDDVRHYHIRASNRFLIYTPHGVDVIGCESVLNHLEQFKRRLEGRATQQEWYELQQPQERYVPDYESLKIIYPDIAKESRFALDRDGHYPADTTFVIPTGDLWLLGILNSSASFYFLRNTCPVLGDSARGGRLRLKLNYMQALPIPRLDPKNKADQAAHDLIVKLVEQMLKLHQDRAAAKTPHEQTALDRQIAATDKRIDQEVYALYGLTPEEIALVEGTAAATTDVAPSEAPGDTSATDDDEDPAPRSYGGSNRHMMFLQETPPAYGAEALPTRSTSNPPPP